MMNDFRLILLGIGLLIIAGIYLHEIVSRKRRIRSRVEKISISENDNIPNISFNHDDENNNFSDIHWLYFHNLLNQAFLYFLCNNIDPLHTHIVFFHN